MQGRTAKPSQFKQFLVTNGQRFVRPVLLFVALCLALIGWRLDWEFQTHLKTKQQNLAQSVLVPRANVLTAAINRRLSLIDSIVAFIHTHPEETHIIEEFMPFAEGLYQSGVGIRAIEIFPDGINKFTYPLSNNSNVLGHNLLTDIRPQVRLDVQRAIKTGRITLSGPYILRQGGMGLVARKAVYHDGHFWGLAVVVLDLPPLLKEANLNSSAGGLRFTLITDHGKRLIGPLQNLKDSLGKQRVKLPDGYWTIVAFSNNSWKKSYETDLWWFRFVLTIVIALLLFIAYLINTWQNRLASLVNERTQELITINRALEDDISARKRMEQELIESEKRYRTLVEQASDGIILIDESERFIDVNTMACEMLGYTRNELVGKTFNDLIPMQDLQDNPSRLREVPPGEVKRFERRLLRKDGRFVQVEATARLLENGGYLTIVRDISDQRRIEQINKTFFANSIIGRFIVDRENHVLQINDEMIRIAGLPSPNFFGKTLQEVFPMLAPMFLHFCQQAIKNDVTIRDLELSWEIPGKPEDQHYWLSSFFPIKDMDGQLLCVGATFMEITQRKQTEHELKRLNIDLEGRVSKRTAQLEAAIKELESFSYSVSHDLRAPLRAVSGFSQALLEDYGDKLDGRAIDYLHRVHQGSVRMGHLIDDLLKLSRITRAELNLTQIDFSLLAAAIADELCQSCPERVVEWIIPSGLKVFADLGLIRIVLENLLGNAFKFTQKNTETRIELGSYVENGEIVFFIRDNGAGFDMAYAERLFVPFQRLHKTEEFEGTGIGLATVRRIINRHGGRIWAIGALGEGATFYFTLGQVRGGAPWRNRFGY